MTILSIFFKALQFVILTISTIIWSFFLGIYIHLSYKNQGLIFEWERDLLTLSSLVDLILLFGVITFVISYMMRRTRKITTKQLAILLGSAIAISTIHNIITASELYP